MSRGAVRVAGAATVAVLATVALLFPTAQATTYRYWTYWVGDADGWTYSPVGPASDVPADGTVQGWRFAVTEGVRGQGKSPRLGVSEAFSRFCGTTPATPGRKRVAVVLDFGDPADAPAGEAPPAARGTCVLAEVSATGARILSSAAQVRTDRGLVCAIAGYPAGECAPAVEEEAPTRLPTQSTRPEQQSSRSARMSDPSRGRAPAGAPAGSRADEEPAESRGTDTVRSGQEDTGGDGVGGGATSGQRSAASGPTPSGGAATSTPATPSSPTATPTGSPGTPSADTAGAAPSTTPPPVFVEATTLEAPATDDAPASWLPLAVTGGALAVIGGVIVWRRRGSRAPRW